MGCQLAGCRFLIGQFLNGGVLLYYHYLLCFICRPHDIRSQSGLTSLYNQNVVRAEHVERPIPGAFGIKHSGVRVTTNDGKSRLFYTKALAKRLDICTEY